VFRVLPSGGRFVAFDPNRMILFMYLYRTSSPFYSNVGVTEKERPVLAHRVADDVFKAAGFTVGTDYLSGLSYRYVASKRVSVFLPIYDAIDRIVFDLAR
jgi:hypothetical protein